MGTKTLAQVVLVHDVADGPFPEVHTNKTGCTIAHHREFEIFNTDQGSQFTSFAFTTKRLENGPAGIQYVVVIENRHCHSMIGR